MAMNPSASPRHPKSLGGAPPGAQENHSRRCSFPLSDHEDLGSIRSQFHASAASGHHQSGPVQFPRQDNA